MLHNFNYISLSINKVLQCPHRTQEMLDESQNNTDVENLDAITEYKIY